MFGAILMSLAGSLMGGLSQGMQGLRGFLMSLFGQKKQYKYQQRLQDDAQAFNAEQSELSRLFNAQEAQLNRDFNAREAELARQWQEEFYNKYQSPSAMMAQYKDAGINPVLAVGQPTNTPPGASSASGSAASSSPGSSGIGSAQVSSLVQDIVSMVALKAQIQSMDAETQLKRAQARGVDSQIALNDSVIGLNNSQTNINKMSLSEISQRTKFLLAQTNNEEERKGLIALQKVTEYEKSQNLKYDRLKKEWERQYYNIYKSYPSTGLWDGVRNIVELVRFGSSKLIDEFRGH